MPPRPPGCVAATPFRPPVSRCSFISGFLLLVFTITSPSGHAADSKAPLASTPLPSRVPVVYCTDLFHPHEDPDDHFDLVTLYSMAAIDLRGIVLDQGARQRRSPGRIPVGQLNHLAGRKVPTATGLASPLHSPRDTGADQSLEDQGGVTLILETLRQSTEPVALIAVGSVRDLAAAWNREPELMRRKTARVLVFIGEASNPDFREYNVSLDLHAYVGLMRSALPIDWVPCFDGGLWQNRGHASFWRASHRALLAAAAKSIQQFFVYALERETADPLAFLAAPPAPERLGKLLAGERNLWCTAVFASVAGLGVRADGTFAAFPIEADRSSGSRPALVYEFEPLPAVVSDTGVIRPASDAAHSGQNLETASPRLRRFVVRDPDHYAEAMTRATAAQIAAFPLAKP